jgi:hypothetical protein
VQILVIKFEFGGSFVVSLEGDYLEPEVTQNLELASLFGESLS